MDRFRPTRIRLDRIESPLSLGGGRTVTSGFWISQVEGQPECRGSGRSPAEALRRLADEMEALEGETRRPAMVG